ncbi:MAG: PIN domain-containing protein [Bryobacteraceae bacterium]
MPPEARSIGRAEVILVDSSVWIGFIRNRATIPRDPDLYGQLVTCGPVLQEVLQGLRPGPFNADFREAMLAIPCLGNPLSLDTFLAAADIYQQGRNRGFTIRSSFDCLIAAIAMEHNAAVWHHDRDFGTIAKYTSLRATSRLLH